MDSTDIDEIIALDPPYNGYAHFSFWCGIIGVCCLPAIYSPLLAIFPFVDIIGFLAGVIGLVIAYRPNMKNKGLKQAWIGCILCAVTFGITGIFYAQMMNYGWYLSSGSNQREIATGLLLYAKDHAGRLPSSFTGLSHYMLITPDKCSCRKYYFYILHTKSPYLLNGFLAGKEIEDFAYPERILLTAASKNNNAKYFFNLSDLDVTDYRWATFLDGTLKPINKISLSTNISDTKAGTADFWFIKPVMRSH